MTWHGSTDAGACSGWALSYDRKIWASGIVSLGSDDWPFTSEHVRGSTWTLEVMQADGRSGLSLAKQQDTLACQLSAGEWKGRLIMLGVKSIQELTPSKWKGSLPKEVHHRIIRSKLSPVELWRLPPESWNERTGKAPGKWHNMWDAIGLNLIGTGRVKDWR